MKNKQAKGPSVMDKIEDVILDDDGKLRNGAMFGLTNLLVVPPVLHTAVKLGFYHGQFPRFDVFKVIEGAGGETFFYSMTRLGEAFDGSYLMLSALGLTAVDIILWSNVERRAKLSQNSKGKSNWNKVKKYNPIFVYPKGAKIPSEPEEKMGPITKEEEKIAREPGNMILGRVKNGPLCFD